MEQWNWHQFCGHNENFTIWSNNDFGLCFEEIVIILPPLVLLAILSSYYIARTQVRLNDSDLYVVWFWFMKIRFVCTIFLSLASVVQILFTFFLLKISLSVVDYVVCVVSVFTWGLHAIYIWNLRYFHTVPLRGPTSAIVVFLLTVVSLVVHMRSVILQHIDYLVNRNAAEEYTIYIKLGLELIYLLTLFPSKTRHYRTDLFYGSINYDTPETEQVTWEHIHSYGGTDQSVMTAELLEAESTSNIFSKLSFYWLNHMFKKGLNGRLNNATDLLRLPKRLNSVNIEQKFQKVLSGNTADHRDLENNMTQRSCEQNSTLNHDPTVQIIDYVQRKKKVTKQKSLLKCLNSAFGCEYYCLGILKLIADALGFAGPVLLNMLISYIENKNEPQNHGYLYAGGLMATTFLGTIFSTQFDYHVSVVGLKIRCALVTIIYQKTLSVSSVQMAKFDTGQIVNFMSTDTNRIVNFCPSFHAIWSLPFQVSFSLYLLHQQVGLSFLAGLTFAIILIPINRQLAIKIGDLSKKMMGQKDSRVKLMNEVLSGIRVVKFYSWEQHFKEKINFVRDKELNNLKGQKYLDALCVYFWATTPVLISILTFTTYSLLGHTLTAAKVFTSLSLFIMLIGPLNAFPWVINGLMESWVSLKRVEEFLKLEQLDLASYYSPHLDITSSIRVDKGLFSWKSKINISPSNSSLSSQTNSAVSSESNISSVACPTLVLSDINLHVQKGQLLGVIGKVGSGKSSLLHALQAEMQKKGGRISLENIELGFSLATQEPWLQHATVRDNILFGQCYQTGKYDAVIQACALSEDFKVAGRLSTSM
ncbi:ATP-binding cassette sub-family C member 10 isoform X2 [Patella vulgata]|uniref:ATP-binding cassette sub-family C member 10 isoform X2 n=1 Tax=Patella vulgata TaxID=6465 RepID=UPI0024A8FE8C|nr:ATP-binding cassette sub-family C member 10 isoform X2 [Patella vulgata]